MALLENKNFLNQLDSHSQFDGVDNKMTNIQQIQGTVSLANTKTRQTFTHSSHQQTEYQNQFCNKENTLHSQNKQQRRQTESPTHIKNHALSHKFTEAILQKSRITSTQVYHIYQACLIISVAMLIVLVCFPIGLSLSKKAKNDNVYLRSFDITQENPQSSILDLGAFQIRSLGYEYFNSILNDIKEYGQANINDYQSKLTSKYGQTQAKKIWVKIYELKQYHPGITQTEFIDRSNNKQQQILWKYQRKSDKVIN